jgi:hypothetical protein
LLGRLFREGDVIVIFLRVKTPCSLWYLRPARGTRGRIAAEDLSCKGHSFIVGHELRRHRWKQLVPRLHLAGQFVVKCLVIDFTISFKGILVILIQWPHHERIIYPIVGRECNKSLKVREELLEKTVES